MWQTSEKISATACDGEVGAAISLQTRGMVAAKPRRQESADMKFPKARFVLAMISPFSGTPGALP